MNFDFVSWNRKHTFNGEQFGHLLAENKITYLHKIITNSREFKHHRFNRMDARTQEIWEKNYYKPKIEYGFSLITQDETSWFEIPKSVFEMVVKKFPNMIIKEHNYYNSPLK